LKCQHLLMNYIKLDETLLCASFWAIKITIFNDSAQPLAYYDQSMIQFQDTSGLGHFWLQISARIFMKLKKELFFLQHDWIFKEKEQY
jgi:hypothetical protein